MIHGLRKEDSDESGSFLADRRYPSAEGRLPLMVDVG